MVRKKIWDILIDICINKKYSNLVLRSELEGLNIQDKAFATTVVYGTIQNYIYVRKVWEVHVKKTPDETIALLLDFSVYQLLFLDKIPTYAVLNDAVELSKKVFHGKYSKMVNAVLRKVSENPAIEIKGNDEEKLAVLTSHPLWLVKMWSKQYGFETCEKICHFNNGVAKPCARVNIRKTSPEEIVKNNPKFQRGKLAKYSLIYEGGNIANCEEYKLGLVSIQDEASQLVVEYLDLKENDTVLDTCSAPGTKTCAMAEMMNDKGRILALELHEKRCELIAQGVRRLGLNCIETKCMDATDLSSLDEKFDKILVDAPCSGYGVLKRKCDIKYHMKSEDMDGIIMIQEAILEEASKHLKENGTLVYSTCTLNKKENDKQIEKFLKKHEDFKCLEKRTIFPFEYDCDGFFIAKLVKK